MAERKDPLAWLKFFRIVNLPTVPGDVLVGIAAATYGKASVAAGFILASAAVGCLMYLYGLADNDIVGAETDADRPLVRGDISPFAARVARGVCLALALAMGAWAGMSWPWWGALVVLTLAILGYNRTKVPLLMGLCRGLNVLMGVLAVSGGDIRAALTFPAAICVVVWTLYIWGVTRYSRGEELDAAKRRRVGMLVGGIIYLQLVALICFRVTPLLVAGAVLLMVLRLMRRLLPQVSAS